MTVKFVRIDLTGKECYIISDAITKRQVGIIIDVDESLYFHEQMDGKGVWVLQQITFDCKTFMNQMALHPNSSLIMLEDASGTYLSFVYDMADAMYYAGLFADRNFLSLTTVGRFPTFQEYKLLHPVKQVLDICANFPDSYGTYQMDGAANHDDSGFLLSPRFSIFSLILIIFITSIINHLPQILHAVGFK